MLLLLLQSCPPLCDPIVGTPPGSPVPGMLQARTLEWVAISFSSAWKWKVKVKSLSHVQLFATPWTAAYQAPLSMGFSRQGYWSGVPSPFPININEGFLKSVLLIGWDGLCLGISCSFSRDYVNWKKISITWKNNQNRDWTVQKRVLSNPSSRKLPFFMTCCFHTVSGSYLLKEKRPTFTLLLCLFSSLWKAWQ